MSLSCYGEAFFIKTIQVYCHFTELEHNALNSNIQSIKCLYFTVRWVCRQRLLNEAHIISDESPRLQIDLMLVTLVEGVIAQGKNETSFQVEYSLDNVTWVNVSHHGEPQVNGFVITLTKWFIKLTIFILVDSTSFKQRQLVIPETRTHKEHCNILNNSFFILL